MLMSFSRVKHMSMVCIHELGNHDSFPKATTCAEGKDFPCQRDIGGLACMTLLRMLSCLTANLY